MKASEQSRFDTLYQRHLRALKLQGLSDSTIDVYARAVRRLTQHYDCCPEQLTTEQLEVYFAELVESHSWSTVKVDRNGLRLGETLALEVGDIDGPRQQVHIRRGKGHKDRLVPLPDLTCAALRALWCKHRHPRLLFPSAVGTPERIRNATTSMDRGGAQAAMKAVVRQCGIKKKSLSTRCATASRRTCSNKASVCVISKACSAMPAPPPPRAMPI